jgi:hypothetical protein
MVSEPDVYCHGFLMRDVVDGFKYETMIIFVFGPSQNIVADIVRFYLLISLCEHEMFI